VGGADAASSLQQSGWDWFARLSKQCSLNKIGTENNPSKTIAETLEYTIPPTHI